LAPISNAYPTQNSQKWPFRGSNPRRGARPDAKRVTPSGGVKIILPQVEADGVAGIRGLAP
jgi:hypothetical protein